MDSRRIVANMTEESTASVIGVDLQGELVVSDFDALDGAAGDLGVQLVAQCGQAERVKRRSHGTKIEFHHWVRR